MLIIERLGKNQLKGKFQRIKPKFDMEKELGIKQVMREWE